MKNFFKKKGSHDTFREILKKEGLALPQDLDMILKSLEKGESVTLTKGATCDVCNKEANLFTAVIHPGGKVDKPGWLMGGRRYLDENMKDAGICSYCGAIVHTATCAKVFAVKQGEPKIHLQGAEKKKVFQDRRKMYACPLCNGGFIGGEKQNHPKINLEKFQSPQDFFQPPKPETDSIEGSIKVLISKEKLKSILTNKLKWKQEDLKIIDTSWEEIKKTAEIASKQIPEKVYFSRKKNYKAFVTVCRTIDQHLNLQYPESLMNEERLLEINAILILLIWSNDILSRIFSGYIKVAVSKRKPIEWKTWMPDSLEDLEGLPISAYFFTSLIARNL